VDDETENVRSQTPPQEASIQVEMDQEGLTVNSKPVEKPVDVNEVTVDVSQTGSDTPTAGTFSQAVTDDKPEDVRTQTVAQSDMWAARSSQAEIDTEKRVVDPRGTEKQIDDDEYVESPQYDSEMPTGSSETLIDSEAQPVRSQTVTQTAASTNKRNPDISETVPFTTAAESAKPVVDSEDVHTQVIEKTTVGTHTNLKPAEKTDSDSTTTSGLGTNPQVVTSGIPAQEFDDARRTDAEDPQTHEVALPVSPAGSQETQVSLKPEAYVNEDPGQQDLSADQTHLTDEKIRPAEKEHEPNGISESTSHMTTPHKEAVAIGTVEKGPAVPVNLHAVEAVQQVIRQLNGRLKSGPTSMRLQLNPEELGAIEVEMIRDSQGVSVTFFAEQASTGKLLETQLGQLRQSLVDSGVQLSGLNIDQHGHTGQEGGFQHQNTNFAQTSQHESFHTEVSTKERPRAEQVTGQTSEVDYRI
jgi:flagellar hook-length control protein FliK